MTTKSDAINLFFVRMWTIAMCISFSFEGVKSTSFCLNWSCGSTTLSLVLILLLVIQNFPFAEPPCRKKKKEKMSVLDFSYRNGLHDGRNSIKSPYIKLPPYIFILFKKDFFKNFKQQIKYLNWTYYELSCTKIMEKFIYLILIII